LTLRLLVLVLLVLVLLLLLQLLLLPVLLVLLLLLLLLVLLRLRQVIPLRLLTRRLRVLLVLLLRILLVLLLVWLWGRVRIGRWWSREGMLVRLGKDSLLLVLLLRMDAVVEGLVHVIRAGAERRVHTGRCHDTRADGVPLRGKLIRVGVALRARDNWLSLDPLREYWCCLEARRKWL